MAKPETGLNGQRANRAFRIMLAGLLMGIGLDCASAIVTAKKNENLVEGRIAIGLREELGKHREAIERIVLANPRTRLGWPSAYEISADPDWPDNFYLIDMNNQVASSAYRVWNQVPATDVPVQAAPLFIGRLDDGSFASGLDAALRRIERRWQLIRLRRNPAFGKETFIQIDCIESDVCTPPSPSTTLLREIPLSVEVSVGPKHVVPQYVYVLMIKPDHRIEWLYASSDGRPAAAGSSFRLDSPDQPFSFSETGAYDFLTITSDTPINAQLLAADSDGAIAPSACQTALERTLCTALSGGSSSSLPVEPWHLDAGWSISTSSTFYARDPSAYAVGGGADARMGTAPWAVQIYSARPYSEEQKIADRGLPDTNPEKKFLDQLSTGQEEHRCGGSMIAPDVVLTAAHCVVQRDLDFLAHRRVHVGSQTLRGEPGDRGADYQIVSAVYHSGYVPSRDRPSVVPPVNDIALLKIKPLGKRVITRRVSLPDEIPGFATAPVAQTIKVYGWGFTRVRKPNQSGLLVGGKPLAYAQNLQVGNLRPVDTRACQGIPFYGAIGPGHLCAETPPPAQATRGSTNTFSCRGDSGGPVVREMGQWTVQVGIVSWAYGCGVAAQGAKLRPGQKNPSVFVNVARYSRWIAKAKASFTPNRVSAVTE